MLLQPAPSIHTAFMRFPIDVVFMDGTLRVIKVIERLRPWRAVSAHRGLAVLELSVDEASRREIAVGDQLGVVEVTDRLGAFMANSEWRDGRWAGGSERRVGGAVNGFDGGPNGSDPVASNGRHGPPDATRVLLVGADRRFRSVAAALLTRRGCQVTLADKTGNVADLAGRGEADVVVFDMGTSLTDAAYAAAQVEALNPRVGMVIVGEETQQGLSAMPVLPKWGSFDVLYGAIENAQRPRERRLVDGCR
jgi:CheY-like chemotaxis protein